MARFGDFKAIFFERDDLNTPLQDSSSVAFRTPVSGATTAFMNAEGRTELVFGYDSQFTELAAPGRVCVCYQYDAVSGTPYIGGVSFCLPFFIETISPMGPGLIRIEGPDLLSQLKDLQWYAPIGAGTTTNTTVAVAVVDQASTTQSAPATANADTVTVTSATNWAEGVEARITLDGDAGVHVTVVRSMASNVATLRDRLPAAAASGNAAVARQRKVTVASGQGAAFVVGAECRLTLDDTTTHTTIIEEAPEGDVITMRDGAPDSAAVGKAIQAKDYSQPTTSDVSTIMSYMSGWTTDFDSGGYTGTAAGTHHAPLGESVYDLLVTTAKQTGEFFRLKEPGTAIAPAKTVVWKRAFDYAGYGGNLRLVQSTQANIDSDAANINRAIITGDPERQSIFNPVTRIVPFAGDKRITLALCSEAARLLAAVEGFTLVDTGLGLYTPPYLYDAAAEATELGVIGRAVTFSHIRTETDSAVEWQTAADSLMRSAIAYLYEHGTAARYRYVVPGVVSPLPIQPGQRIEMVYTSPDGRWSVNKTGVDALYVLEVRSEISPAGEQGDGSIRAGMKLMTLVLIESPWDLPDIEGATAAAVMEVARIGRQGAGSTDTTTAVILGGGGSATDHGSLTGLGDDDHPHYLRADGTRAMTGSLTMGSGLTVDGVDISAHAADANAHHAAVTAFDASIAIVPNQMLRVKTGTNSGLGVGGDGLIVQPKTDGGLETSASGVGVKLPTNSGLVTTSSGLYIGTPGTITATSSSGVTGAAHNHAVTSSNDTSGGIATTLLASSSEGGLGVARLGVGIAPNTSAAAYIRAKATDDYSILLKQLSGQTADMWRVEDTAGNPLIRLTGGGDLESGTPGFTSGQTGWQIAANGDAEFNDVFVRGELHATTFVADEMHATGGTLAVMTVAKVAPAVGGSDNTLPSTGSSFTLNVQASYDTGLCYFSANDVIRIKTMGEIASGGSLDLYDIYLTVTSVGSQAGRDLANGEAGYHPLTCVRRYGGATGFVIPAGSAAVRWAKVSQGSGYTGGIILTSDLQYSPYIDIFTVDATQTGATWQSAPVTPKPRVRVGNLRGVLGKSADEWGMAAGTDLSDATTAARYIVASDLGLDLRNIDLSIYSGADKVIGLERTNGLEFLINTTFDRVRSVTWENSVGSPVASIAANITGSVVHMELGIDPTYGTSSQHVTGLDIYSDTGVSWVNVTADNLITDGAFYAGGGMALTGTVNVRNADESFDHGMTTPAPSSDTYLYIAPVTGPAGGARLMGFSETTVGIRLDGYATTVTTGTGTAPVVINSLIKSGTDGGAVGSGNLVTFNNNGSSRVIFKYNGDIYSDSTAGVILFDSYDDPALLRALSYELNPAGVIRDEWDRFVNYNRHDLEAAGILDGTMVNQTALGRLLTGAVWQLARRVAALETGVNRES